MNWAGLLLLRLPLALWVGGGVVAGAIVAPATFRLLPSRDQAGALFGAVLERFGAMCHVLSVWIVIGVFEQVSVAGRVEGPAAVTAVGAFLAVAANVYGTMVLRPRMNYCRSQVESFDAVPPEHPWRERFDRLHRRSERVALFGLACALAALLAAP
jgi:uncharacterized membrane protein